jgi:hypothetical protein
VHLPQSCCGGELRSEQGALALAFWNPILPAYAYPVTRNRTCMPHTREWTNSMPGAHGVMHKSLRLPDPVPHPNDEGFDGGPGGYLRFQYIAPQMIAETEHVHHECWEEIILLQGDVMLLNEGQIGSEVQPTSRGAVYFVERLRRTGPIYRAKLSSAACNRPAGRQTRHRTAFLSRNPRLWCASSPAKLPPPAAHQNAGTHLPCPTV